MAKRISDAEQAYPVLCLLSETDVSKQEVGKLHTSFLVFEGRLCSK
jgi:hypothetical protein